MNVFQALEDGSADLYRMVKEKSMRNTIWLVVILTLILMVMSIFQQDLILTESAYLTLHTVLETFSVFVAIMVFAVGWHGYTKEQPANYVLLACAFLVVGLVDFSHTLSFQGMPEFFTPSDPEKAINFWLIARLVASLSLFAVILLPWKPLASIRLRYIYLLISVLFVILVHWVGFYHADWFPRTFIEGEGLTSFKIGMEYLIISIHVLTAAIIILQLRQPLPYNAAYLLAAALIMALSELCFTLYYNVKDVYNLLGHIYKFIAFTYIYRTIIVDHVQLPLLRMRSSQQTLRKSQRWFNTTLTSIRDAVITTDMDGAVTFMNPAAEKLAGCTFKQALGKNIDHLFTILKDRETKGHEDFKCILDEHNHTSEHLIQEALVISGSGARISALCSVSPIKDHEETIGLVYIFHDITKWKEVEQTQQRQIAILEATTDFVATADEKGRVLYYNSAARRMLGIDEDEEIAHLHIQDTHPQWAADLVLNEGMPIAERDGVWSGETAFINRNGEEIPVSQVIIAHKYKEGKVEYYSTVARDVSDIKQAEEKQLLAAKVLENMNESVIVTDVNGNIISVNPAFTKVTGYTEDEVIGKNPRILSSGRHDSEFYRQMWTIIHQEGMWEGEIWNKRKNGEIYLEGVTISAVKDEHGQLNHYVAVFRDITEHRRLEEQIEYQAYHDTLTQLPNRVLLYDRLNQAIARARRHQKKLAVMFLDLDRFKRINDTLGHSTGDQLLKAVAERLTGVMRTSDTVARQGGDEFIILLPEIEEIQDAVTVSEKIIETLKKPFFLEGHELFITTSIGISIFPDDGSDRETLIKNADTAMYRAKEQGRNNFQFYQSDHFEGSYERLSMETDLRKALSRGEFVLYYQPRVELESGKIVGMEALIRWNHPQYGIISPAQFIPMAEETGLIISLGKWVLSEACRQNKIWQERGFSNLKVAVNLSMMQFKQKELADQIKVVLEETGLDPQYLEMELTESILMNNPDVTLNTLHKLKGMGIRIALDDFGTGYSSLNYLKRFPIDMIKIDQSFVRDIMNNQDDRAIVTAMINLAHSLNLRVIAEGVEKIEQLQFLMEMGCDEVQGYYCSHPIPAEEFESLLIGNQGNMKCIDV